MSVVVPEAISKPAVRVGRKSPFYVALSAFMTALVLGGFWPYYAAVFRGDDARPGIIHVHGAVFTGWMVLLIAQVTLAWRGRLRMHRRVGEWGIAYGLSVLTVGIVVGIAAPVMHVNAGEWTPDRAASFLLITLGDMVLFGSLFGAAVAYRRQPEVHKRLMVAATVALLFAAVSRIGTLETNRALYLLVWLSPLLIGMVHDWHVRGRPHVAYVVSGVWLFIGASRELLMASETWLIVGRAVLSAF